MKKRILSLFLLLGVTLGALAGCQLGGDTSSDGLSVDSSVGSSVDSSSSFQEVDYVSQTTLDWNSETLKQEVTVKFYIDGDTTHFNVPKTFNEDGVLKARYLAVNTPESTGKIEEWGKKASNFTKSCLENAASIVVETDGSKWEVDSTGERYLVWVWYKPQGSDTYRNLNLELLQSGLAVGSKAGSTRYGEACTKAIYQASVLKLYVHSKEKDPDYFYGTAHEIDLKELRLNLSTYEGQRVAFNGVISYYSSNGVYVESYDEETNMYYGIYAYYGFNLDAEGVSLLAVGNKVRIVGNVQAFNGSYQVSDLRYDPFDLNDPENIQLLDDQKYPTANTLTSMQKFTDTVNITTENEETGEPETKTYKYAELALDTSIAMNNLRVKSIYTTATGSSKGAMTITCEADGEEIEIRTLVMKDNDGNLITADAFEGKTINVTGIVDTYNGEYQIQIFTMNNITFVS